MGDTVVHSEPSRGYRQENKAIYNWGDECPEEERGAQRDIEPVL